MITATLVMATPTPLTGAGILTFPTTYSWERPWPPWRCPILPSVPDTSTAPYAAGVSAHRSARFSAVVYTHADCPRPRDLCRHRLLQVTTPMANWVCLASARSLVMMVRSIIVSDCLHLHGNASDAMRARPIRCELCRNTSGYPSGGLGHLEWPPFPRRKAGSRLLPLLRYE